jgi:hypothetical protein
LITALHQPFSFAIEGWKEQIAPSTAWHYISSLSPFPFRYLCTFPTRKMPNLARKVIICAAIDGLVIQPLSSKGQRPSSPVRIKYSDASISPVSRDQVPDLSKPNSSFEAFGIVGEFAPSPSEQEEDGVLDKV